MAYDSELTDRVRAQLKGKGDVSERKMFGCLAFMVNGNMCCGVLEGDLFLKLSLEGAEAAKKKPHAGPFAANGKMKSMIKVNAKGTSTDRELKAWIEMALAFTNTRAPKAAKKKSANKLLLRKLR